MKTRMLFALLVVSALALGACGQTPATPVEPATTLPAGQPTESAPAKDTLVMLSAESFTGSWDPSGHTVLANLHLENLVFDRLWEIDWTSPDKEFVPRLALSWEYQDDGATLEIKLRPGVKFHDGTEFGAEDVVATLARYTDRSRPMGFFWPEPIVGTVVDPLTVELKTQSGQSYAPLVNHLSWMSVISSEDVEQEERLTTTMNGTGAFTFVSYQNEEVTLAANENYWDKAPQIKTVIYRYVADPATRLAALQSGEADLIERVDTDQVGTIEADSNLVLTRLLSNETKNLVFKWQVPPMNEKLVRQAIGYAIDRETIVNEIMGGDAGIADSFVAPAVLGHAPAMGFPTYDPDKAKDLLAEAGYPGGAGLPKMTYLTSVGFYPKTKEYGELIVANLAEVGIDCELQPMETASWLSALYSPTPGQMVDTGWMNVGPDPDATLAGLYGNPGLTTGGGSDAIAALLVQESRMVDPAARAAFLRDTVFPAIADELPQMPLFSSMLIYAQNKHLQGFVPAPTSEMVSIRNAYFTQ